MDAGVKLAFWKIIKTIIIIVITTIIIIIFNEFILDLWKIIKPRDMAMVFALWNIWNQRYSGVVFYRATA